MVKLIQDPMPNSSAALSWAKRLAVVVGIGGGVAGLVSSAQALYSLTSISDYLLWSVFSCLYALGVWLGFRVLENRSGALDDFSVYLWLQVPILQSTVLTYFFATLGSCTWIYRRWPLFDFGWTIGSGWTFSLFTFEPEFGIGINLWPIVLLALFRLARVRR